MNHPDASHPSGGCLVEVAGVDLAFRGVQLADATPTGRQVLSSCGLSPHSDYVVLQLLPSGDVEEVRPEEPVDVSSGRMPRLIVERADRTFRFQLDDRSLEWPAATIAEETLRKLGGVAQAKSIHLRREEEVDLPLEPGTSVDLRVGGTEVFYSKAATWKLNVQGVVVESESPEIIVRDALGRAGFDTAAAWIIVLKTASERRQVELDAIIDLRQAGIEKLRLTPREINNGEVIAPLSRGFALLPSDEAGLDGRGLRWSTLVEAGRRWLLIEDMPLPSGYDVASVTIAMEIPATYPAAEVDMFYCHPHLRRLDGVPIPQTQVFEQIGGRSFQRWSRHRGAMAPWRPGADSVLTHLALVDASISREVEP